MLIRVEHETSFITLGLIRLKTSRIPANHSGTAELNPIENDSSTKHLYQKNVRIYHKCEGRIEKSVPRIAVWHHEACRMMTNGDPEGRFFLSYLTRMMDSLFLHTIVFIFSFIN